MTTIVLRKFLPRVELRPGTAVDAYHAKANGQNNLWRVWVWTGIDHRAAVAAQELYEWEAKLCTGVVAATAAVGLLGALAALLDPIFGLGVLPALVLAFLGVPKLLPVRRRMELGSHEVEVQAAAALYGADQVAYRWHEIGSKERGGMVTYAWLKGMKPMAIEAEMKRRSDGAARWVKHHRSFLERVRDAGNPVQQRIPVT